MRDLHVVPASRAGLKLLFTLFLFFLGMASVPAQTLHPANVPDSIYATPAGAGRLNNALLDYSCNNGGQLMAVVWDEAPGVNCDVFDGITHLSVTVPVPSGYTSTYGADVILGGDNTNGTTFYVGITYVAVNAIGAKDIFFTSAILTDPGGSFAVDPLSCSTPLQITGSGTVDLFAVGSHIDIIAKYDGVSTVTADHFVISWTDGSGPFDIYGFYCNGLNFVANNCTFPSTAGDTLTQIMNTASTFIVGDVAGLEHFINSTSTIDDVAFFAYVDQMGNLYRQRWDMSTNIVDKPVLIDQGPIKFPRIDAIDCYTENASANGYANYDIVYNERISGSQDVMSYNALSGIVDCSSAGSSVWGSYFPVVACGPGVLGTPSTYQYDIVYNADSIANPSWDLYSQMIDWTSGSLSPSASDYYQVNQTNTNTGFSGIVTAISSAVNNLVPDNVFVVWYNNTTGTIDYKRSGSPVAYKPASVTYLSLHTSWQLSPNPTTDYLYLTTSATDIQNTTYTITDITGRIMQQALVTSARQQVSVSDLPPGMYMLNISAHDAILKTIKFVKE